MDERAGFGPLVSPPELAIPLRAIPSSHREMPRSIASGNCAFDNAIVVNHRSWRHVKSLSRNPPCASSDRHFGWRRPDLGRASELPRCFGSANHEHGQDASLYEGRAGRSRSTRRDVNEIQHRRPVQLRAHHDGLRTNLHRVTHVSRNGK